VLEIERYSDEPLQLVNLRIGTQSVKDRIRQKFKDNKSKLGTDRVSFKERDDWFKRVSITLRNTSTKPVYGLRAYLYFKPAGFPMIFSMTLTGSRQLRNDPLQPGAEIDLTVSPGYLNRTLDDLKYRGLDASHTDVTFSLDAVIFSDELQWHRGHLVRPDSAIPDKWVPVDDPVAAKRNKPSVNTPLFVTASFKAAAPVNRAAPFVFATCTQWNGSHQGTSCSGDPADCVTWTDIDDNIEPGLLSHQSVFGLCEDRRDLGLECHTSTTHTKLLTDSNCQVCPDADNDGYPSSACGGSDCNDSNSSINPGATENCSDSVDNNCNNLTDEQEHCACPVGEYDIWVGAGIGYDCTLCQDGEDNDCDDAIDALDSGCRPDACASPVLVDIFGNGFDLTNAINGVSFDLNSDGTRETLSWTAPQSDDAWLALDRNGDGVINNGTELFGNFTPQSNPPPGMGRNGFNALIEYDKADKGGNADGFITERDTVFGNLLLWQDMNHNGSSEANELHSLKQFGLTTIECNYQESKRRDRYGNLFRYRAKVSDMRNTKISRWAWDVFLVHDGNSLADNLIRSLNWRITGSIRDWLLE
jgi:hypothetical protein